MKALSQLLMTALFVAACASQPDADPAPAVDEVGEWAGSESCAECHAELHERWAKTAHARSVTKFSPDAVAKPFDGEVVTARDIDHRVGPGPYMWCEGPGGEFGKFEVSMVLGVTRLQMYMATLPRGRIQVLPILCEVPAQRWFDYGDMIFGKPEDFTIPPDSEFSWYGPGRNFNSGCGRCHTTNFKLNYDADTGSYESTWTETGEGCETCHGPGGAHVRKWRRDEKEGPDPIVNPAKLPLADAQYVCGSCHTKANMVVPGYEPGHDLFTHYDVSGFEDTLHVFPDGRVRELIHNLVPLLESKCGPLACTHCHDPHGSGRVGDLYDAEEDDGKCTKCHTEYAKNLEAHTHHKPESTGSRCVNCHMPRLVIEGGHGHIRDHTISSPSIVNTKEHGLPNACRTCHLEEEPGWEYESFEEWYPEADKRNHRVALAAAFAPGREGKPEAKDRLLAFMKDPNPIYRAGAVRALARYNVDLRAALQDKHALVRRAAVAAVATRTPEALVPALDDPNPVIRRAAAQSLATWKGLAQRPELRDRVIGLLERFSKLRPDDAGLHRLLWTLHAAAGNEAEAKAAEVRYRHLRPWEK